MGKVILFVTNLKSSLLVKSVKIQSVQPYYMSQICKNGSLQILDGWSGTLFINFQCKFFN